MQTVRAGLQFGGHVYDYGMTFPFSISGRFDVPAAESAIQALVLRATDALREVSDSVGHSHDRVWSRPGLLAVFSRPRGGRNPTFFCDRIDLRFRATATGIEVTYRFGFLSLCTMALVGAAIVGAIVTVAGPGPWLSHVWRGVLVALVGWLWIFGLNYSVGAEAPDWLKSRLAG